VDQIALLEYLPDSKQAFLQLEPFVPEQRHAEDLVDQHDQRALLLQAQPSDGAAQCALQVVTNENHDPLPLQQRLKFILDLLVASVHVED